MSGITKKLYDITEEFDELISAIDDFSDYEASDLKNIKNRDVSRPMATKLIWTYIKQEGLQNESNKREIWCDDILQNMWKSGAFKSNPVKKKMKMFDVAKLVSANIEEK